MRAASSMFSFNRGVVSRLGLARLDVKRLALAAETQTNWMPRVLGSMMLRPGLKYLGSTLSNAAARYLKFIFATNDTALLEFTNTAMRVWINDALLTRPTVTTAFTNGTFTTDLSGWADDDEVGGVSSWLVGGYMKLLGNGTAKAIREQEVTVAGGNISVEHGIRIIVTRGPVTVRIGATSGSNGYLQDTVLATGAHSISITPTGNFFLRFFSSAAYAVLVDSCTIESAGAMSLPTPWTGSDVGNIRADQSGDVVFVACAGFQQRQIERRGTRPNARSWSVVLYTPQDGPFGDLNTTTATITPSALTGDITMTASEEIFNNHVGALYSLASSGQTATATGAASATSTASIRVTGVGTDRAFAIVISGDNTASTVNLERSYDNTTFAAVSGQTWTADVSTNYNDTLDNQIIYYRLTLATRIAPDSVTMTIRIGSGSVRGIVEITAVANSTSVSARVLSALGGTAATTDWQEGKWSFQRGWPTAVQLHEGRLWWAGINGIWGSISDSYDSFDETFEGDAGPINRTIGAGPVDTVNWLQSLKGLVLGAQGAEHSIRASTLDEPLTPTNFNIKRPSTQGSDAVQCVQVDQGGCFVNRSGMKVFELSYEMAGLDFGAKNLMELAPDLGRPGIVRMDVQRQPDTRLHCVRSDGTAAVAIWNKAEDVLAWIEVETDGLIEDVVVLPALEGESDDQVYYVVQRTISGSPVRYLEKWAQEIDCLGDSDLCLLADSFKTYSGAAVTAITGLSHLEGEQVVVWADGEDVGTVDTARPWTQTYTVTSGQITLAVAASKVVVGLGYTAQFKSVKLGIIAQGSSPLNQGKRIDHLGLVLADVHPKGLKYGPTLDDTGSMRMDDMPEVEQGVTIDPDEVRASYDENRVEFPGTWTSDMRLCLQAQAPRPVTVLAATIDMVQN